MHLSFSRKSRAVLAFSLLLGASHLLLADSIAISSSITNTELGHSSDSLSFQAASGTFDSDAGPFVFQTGNLYIGCSNIPAQVIAFSLNGLITLNGVRQNVTISGQDAVTDTADTLTIFAGAPVNFGNEIFTLQSFTVTGFHIGDDIPVELRAEVTPQTPEPSSLFLLGTGLVGSAFIFAKKTGSALVPIVPTQLSSVPSDFQERIHLARPAETTLSSPRCRSIGQYR